MELDPDGLDAAGCALYDEVGNFHGDPPWEKLPPEYRAMLMEMAQKVVQAYFQGTHESAK